MPQANRSVQPEQRFQDGRRCPICGGAAEEPQGEGTRCYGYLSPDSRRAFCTREEYGGNLTADDGRYSHRVEGECGCGSAHGGDLRARHRADTSQHRERIRGPLRVVGNARYYIRDVDGTLRGIHQRVDLGDGSKRLWWERPDGSRSNGAVHPDRLPLYGIEQLKDHPADEPVYLTEGEKARNALAEAGLPAVATVTGAQSIPQDEPLRALKGRRVVLWPDHDEQGRAHMSRIGARLRALGISFVIYAWADAPPGGDAADYTGTIADLTAQVRALLVEANAITPAENTRTPDEEAVHARVETALDAGDVAQALSALGDVAVLDRAPYYDRVLPLILGRPQFEIEMLVNLTAHIFKCTTATVRADLKALAGGGAEPDSEPGVHILDPEPWPDPVDGDALADLIRTALEEYTVQPEHNVVAEVLWCFFSYTYDAFLVSPMLAITSPVMRCGKTRVLELLSRFVSRPVLTSNISGPALFRMVHLYHPTLVADEVERYISDRNDELTGILNASFSKGFAFVTRTVGDSFKVTQFSTWCPKCFALIGALTPTLMDRSIEIKMKRKKSSEPVSRLQYQEQKDIDALAIPRKMLRWANDTAARIEERYQHLQIPADVFGPDDRAADKWRPLLAVADVLGGEWPARALAAARVFGGHSADQEDGGNADVLRDVLAVFGQDKRLPTSSVLSRLNSLPGSDYKIQNRGNGMTDAQLARALRGFEVKPKKIRIGTKTVRGYIAADFADAIVRYLKPEAPPAPEREPVQ